MTRNTRVSSVFAFVLLFSLSAFGQWSGTVVDVDEGNRRLQVETDDGKSRLAVETDSVSTQYNGFGTMIGGKPEIFIGSKGFSNVRAGDRIDIRGTTRGRGVVMASDVTLLGRSVAASPVGVGDTRSPSSVSTQVDRTTTMQRSTTGSVVEGTVRQINSNAGRLMIQTPQRRLITINAARNTPVYYRNELFQLSNLEVGDRVRIEVDPRNAQADEITAVRIDVVESVQDTSTTVPPVGGTVTVLEGSISRIDASLNEIWVRTRDDEVRTDMSRAEDATGKRIVARDLRVNDTVEVTGSFSRIGDIFLASTIRQPAATRTNDDDFIRYSVVTINGIVTETLDDATTLGIRDRDANRVVRLWATDDFIVRLKAATTTADKLRKDDSVRIKAFRDSAGNFVAQTITVRNR